ncbi:MAG: hypothetical protein AB1403_05330, partial [Candidatus Riflebacteria bacterium]
MNTYRSCKIWQYLPYILLGTIIGFLPFIVRMKLVSFDEFFGNLYNKSGHGNFFTYYRFVWFVFLVGLMLIWFSFQYRIRDSLYNTPIVLYSFFALLSSIFSDFPVISFFGDPERFEGFFVLFSYVFCTFLFSQWVDNLVKQKFFVNVLLFSAFLVAMIGLLQYLGLDYFTSKIFEGIIIPSSLLKITTNSAPEKALQIVTFGNPNYTGSYMAMLFSFTFVLVISRRTISIPLLVLNLILFLNLLVSNSRAGFWGAIISMFFITSFFRGSIFILSRRGILLFFCLLICLPFYLNNFSKKSYREGYLNTGVFRENFILPNLRKGKIGKIELYAEKVLLNVAGFNLNVEYQDGEIFFFNDLNQKIDYKVFSIQDSKKIREKWGFENPKDEALK